VTFKIYYTNGRLVSLAPPSSRRSSQSCPLSMTTEHQENATQINTNSVSAQAYSHPLVTQRGGMNWSERFKCRQTRPLRYSSRELIGKMTDAGTLEGCLQSKSIRGKSSSIGNACDRTLDDRVDCSGSGPKEDASF
jgi:hypothetical protein